MIVSREPACHVVKAHCTYESSLTSTQFLIFARNNSDISIDAFIRNVSDTCLQPRQLQVQEYPPSSNIRSNNPVNPPVEQDQSESEDLVEPEGLMEHENPSEQGGQSAPSEPEGLTEHENPSEQGGQSAPSEPEDSPGQKDRSEQDRSRGNTPAHRHPVSSSDISLDCNRHFSPSM